MEQTAPYKSGHDGSQAFAALYERLAEPALRFAAAVMGNDSLAADAVQEAFLRVHRNLDRFDERKPFDPWFYRILLNECRRAMRWRKRLAPVESMPDRAAPQQDEYRALYEAVGSMEIGLREPLVLHYLMGYRDREIAAILGVSVMAAKGRLKRAREKLRQELLKGDER